MKNTIDRRNFLKSAGALAAVAGAGALSGSPLQAGQLAQGAPHAERLGWRLGCQAYTFNRFTFYEAVDKIQSLGLHYVEMYPNQRLSLQKPDVRTNESMSADVRKELKQRLADADVKLVAFGVCRLPNDEDACRRTFRFAKDMGIETLTSEPPFEALEMIDSLCVQFGVNLAIHNHPEPSTYWNPGTVLEHCKGRSKRVGACADTGHWMRSGVNPTEAIKRLEGRIICFHFKDLGRDEPGGPLHDVPWGTGDGDVQAMLAEIYRQGVKALFSIEYEHKWENNLPEIAQSVKYFDKVASQWT